MIDNRNERVAAVMGREHALHESKAARVLRALSVGGLRQGSATRATWPAPPCGQSLFGSPHYTQGRAAAKYRRRDRNLARFLESCRTLSTLL